MRRTIGSVAAIVSLSLLVIGCGRKPIESTADIKAGQSLVISNVYQERTVKTIFDSAPRTRHSNLYTGFRRFDPSPAAWFSFQGDGESVQAANALPGRYHFRVFDNGHVIYEYEPHNPRYETTVGENEAVYIGDIVVVSFGRTFRLDIRDNREKARVFFNEKFNDSGLKFTTRLLRRVRLDPKLPQ